MDDKYKIGAMNQWIQDCEDKMPPEITEKMGKPYKKKWQLQYIEPFGRCIVATEDISEGEILFVDQAIITGPQQASQVICLGCYRQLDSWEYNSCTKCKWPMCSEECEEKGYHFMECQVFSAANYAPSPDDFNDMEQTPYECILSLRSFLLQKHDPKKWKTVIAMEAHNNLRRGTDLWREEHARINDIIREKGKLKFDDELMHTCTGVLDTNCHEVRSNIPGTSIEYRVRGLYPLTAMMSHDCRSNTHHTVMEDMSMIVVSSTNIKKGLQVTGTYTHLLSGTIERRKHLKFGKLFDCCCERCKDPTELGTYFSALLCSQGRCGGFVINANPLDPRNNPDFACMKCSFVVKAGMVNKLTNMVYYELSSASDSDPTELEMIFNKYKNIFHPNHYHMTGIKHSLSQMYGRVENYLLNDLNEEKMNRKIECCKHLLNMIDILDPGISRLRGLTLYELHAPILLRANRGFQAKEVTRTVFIKQLTKALNLLNLTVHNLQFEPLSSFEGEICKIAKGSADELTKWIDTVRQLSEDNFVSEFIPTPSQNLSSEDLTLESLLKKLDGF